MQVSDFYITIEDPEWQKLFWYYNGYFTILINAFGAYMILFKSSKDMKVYKYYLLHILFWCFFQDIIVNWFFCPGFLMPLEGCYMSTACYFAKFPSQWIWWEIIFTMVVMQNVTMSLVDCFLHRLWCLEEKKWYQSTKTRQYICFLTLHLTYSLSNLFGIYSAQLDRQTMLDWIFKFYPNMTYLNNYTNWAIIPIGLGKIVELCAMWTIEIMVFNIINIYCIIKIHFLLNVMKSHMSPRTIQAQREFITALTIQCFLTFSVYSFPTLMGILTVVLPFSSSLRSEAFTHSMISIFCIHATVNVIVMCWATKPYRVVIVEGFQKFTSKKAKATPTVSLATSTQN